MSSHRPAALSLLTVALAVALAALASNATANGGSAPVNTSVPTVGGTAQVGQILSAGNGTWTGDPTPTFGYQWQRCEGGGAPSPLTPFGTTGTKPRNVAVDSAGNLYVANWGTDPPDSGPLPAPGSVTKITPGGVSTILGATGINPNGIAVDSQGNVYTTNYTSGNVTRITPEGVSTTPFGTTGVFPYAIAVDSVGNVYTANIGTRNVTRITPAGVSNTSAIDSIGTNTYGIAVDSADNLYIANKDAANVTKMTWAGDGSYTTTTLGPTDTSPWGIAVDSDGTVYTANYVSNTVSKITRDGVATVKWADLGGVGSYPYPIGIAVDSQGNVFTSNVSTDSVSKITRNGVATAAWAATGDYPFDVAVDSDGNVFTANILSNDATKITSDPICTDITGATGSTYRAGDDDEGKKLRVKVTATNGGGSADANSALTATVAPATPAAPASSAPPTISGNAVVGQKLTASSGTWTGYPDPTFTYQWERCAATGNGCVAIDQATGNEYTPAEADRGSRLRVLVTATNSQGSGSAASGATELVPGPDPGPTPSNDLRIRSSKVRGSSIITRVRVPGAGNLRQLSTYRTARMRSPATLAACRAERTVTRAGTYTLTCNLNGAARKQGNRGALRVRVRTTFSPTGGTPRSGFRTVVFRGP